MHPLNAFAVAEVSTNRATTSIGAVRRGTAFGRQQHLTQAPQTVQANAAAEAGKASINQLAMEQPVDREEAIEREIERGYDVAFVGVDRSVAGSQLRFEDRLENLVDGSEGPVAIAVNGAGAAAGPADITLAILRDRGRRAGMSVLVDVHHRGKRGGAPTKGLTATNIRPASEIRRALHCGGFDLVVLGTSLRQGETNFLDRAPPPCCARFVRRCC